MNEVERTEKEKKKAKKICLPKYRLHSRYSRDGMVPLTKQFKISPRRSNTTH